VCFVGDWLVFDSWDEVQMEMPTTWQSTSIKVLYLFTSVAFLSTAFHAFRDRGKTQTQTAFWKT
jgi:hypothetical protein